MPSRNYRVTFFFESQQGAQIGTGADLGWTESWYKGNVDKTLEQEILNPEFKTYISKRTAFMPNLYRCSFIRLSDDDNPRRFKITGVDPSIGLGKINVDAIKAAQVQCAVLVDLQRMPRADNETSHHRRFLIRALPSSMINGNVLAAGDPGVTVLRKFADFVGNQDPNIGKLDDGPQFTYGIRFHDPTAIPQKIKEAHPRVEDNRQLLVQCPVMGDFPEKTRVLVKGVPSPNREWNRFWVSAGTTDIGAETWVVLDRARDELGGSYHGPGKATIEVVSWAYGTVDQYVLIGLRNKKTGRSFHLLRGRSGRRR